MSKQIGSLATLAAREVWTNEAQDFTPWLASNIALLGNAIGIDLETEATEVGVGDFRVDIVARDLSTGHVVVIENQLDATDHSHLGQLLTYAAGRDATAVVWVAPRFRDPHREAIDWLNAHSTEGLDFFAVEIELLRVDDSLPAPHFKLVAQPNEWAKARRAPSSGPSDLGLRYQAFFTAILERFKAVRPFVTSANRVGTDNWFGFAAGRAGFQLVWSVAVGARLRVEMYIDTGDQARNKDLFDRLQAMRGELEVAIGSPIEWDRLDSKRGSRFAIYHQIDKATFDQDPKIIEWAVDTMVRFSDVLRPLIKTI